MLHFRDFFTTEPADQGMSVFVNRGIGLCDSDAGARQWPHSYDSVECEIERDITIRIQRHRMKQIAHLEAPWEVSLAQCAPGDAR